MTVQPKNRHGDCSGGFGLFFAALVITFLSGLGTLAEITVDPLLKRLGLKEPDPTDSADLKYFERRKP